MDTFKPELEIEETNMKKVFYTLGLTVVFNVAGMAQKPAKSPDQSTNSSAKTQSAQNVKVANSSNGAASLSAVSNVQAQLQNTLDVKNARVGDEVILKTTQAIKRNGQVVVAKGSQLIGHVTEVQQRAKNGTPSRLGLVFDSLKNGGTVTPISASILSITNAAAAASAGDALDSGLSGSSSTGTRTSSGGSGGGGLLGGVTNTVGGVLNSTSQTVGGVTDTVGQTVGGATSTVGQTINGLQISTSASGSAQSSTTLSSQNNNVHLDKGVTFNLSVQKSGTN